MSHYDYLLVGAGLFNATLAVSLKKQGKKILVIDRRSHVAGNIYTENCNGIPVHKYGAHIFHTSDKTIWDFVNSYAEFNRYTNCPIANYNGQLYNLPFNMNTFNKIWPDVITPEQASKRIREQASEMAGRVSLNLEEQAISLVGRDIYERLIKGYTQKQWGRPCTELDSSVISRLPVRLIFDNNYFNDTYQGIPIGGYTLMIQKMLDGTEIKLNCDYFENRKELNSLADRIIFTGPIDRYYDYCFGKLEYRSLKFETEKKDISNWQGNAVINYTDAKTPYTRIIEHKHFEYQNQEIQNLPYSYITREYPEAWKDGEEPYYAVNNARNAELYEKYAEKAETESKVLFGGRLGMYKYFDMDDTVAAAWGMAGDL